MRLKFYKDLNAQLSFSTSGKWTEGKKHVRTYVLIEGTYCMSVDGVEVLERSGRKPHDKVHLLGAPCDEIEVMADRDGGGLVHTFISRSLQVGLLKNKQLLFIPRDIL